MGIKDLDAGEKGGMLVQSTKRRIRDGWEGVGYCERGYIQGV